MTDAPEYQHRQLSSAVSVSAFGGAACVEPVKRNKDGLRWIIHRFPIRNGITQSDMIWRQLLENLTANNALLTMITRDKIW